MSERTYRIGEAAEQLDLKSYVLRFWEEEFPQLVPLRTDRGQRIYTEKHLELLRTIKRLLHEQGMTIEGARRVLDGGEVGVKVAGNDSAKSSEWPAELEAIQEALLALRKILAKQD